jgi:hypothetical protein
MSLILDANSPIQPAFDPYWDKPMTRREAHVLFMKLASNDNELTGMADTASILLNFLCEKLEVKREDVDTYVARKHVELAAMREQMKKTAEATDAQPNS